jgi:hypothetical protein
VTYPTTTSTTPDGSQQATDLLGALALERNKHLAAWANSEYKKIKNARTSIERQWYINLAFYFGKQNIAVVTTTTSANGFKLVVPKAPPWRVRLVINKVRGIIRTELAKIVSQRPRFTVVPNSTEDDDQTAARVGEQIFDSVYAGYKLKTIFRRAEWWTCITGTGFIKDYWNPSAVDKLGHKGDFCFEPLSPFHVFVPDFDVIDIEQQPYVIHASTKSLEWCRANYPDVKVNTNVQAASDLLR